MATRVDGAIPGAVPENEPLSLVVLDLHYHDGLIGGRIEHAPLGKVLRELALETGMQFKLTEPSFASCRISA
jgi:hypothetical protein